MAKKNIDYLYCYAVLDNTNHITKKFDNYQDALCYKICVANRPDWTIKKARKHYHSTEKQRNFVRTIEMYLNITFDGDIDSGWECSDFISLYKEDYDILINDLIGDAYDALGY